MPEDTVLLRANLLGGMNAYIIDLGDEDIYEVWWALGVPDECSEEMLMDIAEDEQEFNRISLVFGKIINDQL